MVDRDLRLENVEVQCKLLDIAETLKYLGQTLNVEAENAGESYGALCQLASIALVTARSAEFLSEDVARLWTGNVKLEAGTDLPLPGEAATDIIHPAAETVRPEPVSTASVRAKEDKQKTRRIIHEEKIAQVAGASSSSSSSSSSSGVQTVTVAMLPDMGFLRLKQIIGYSGNPEKGKPAIPAIIPISGRSWWAGIKKGIYPKGVKLGERVTAWRAEDVRAVVDGTYVRPKDTQTQ